MDYSEFNHPFAGLLVLPGAFSMIGAYLLVWSGHEAWPIAPCPSCRPSPDKTRKFFSISFAASLPLPPPSVRRFVESVGLATLPGRDHEPLAP